MGGKRVEEQARAHTHGVWGVRWGALCAAERELVDRPVFVLLHGMTHQEPGVGFLAGVLLCAVYSGEQYTLATLLVLFNNANDSQSQPPPNLPVLCRPLTLGARSRAW